MAKDQGLTPKQEAFVNEYLIDRNATRAAIRAGYSAKTAQEQSSRLLSNVMVSATIAERTLKLANKLEITAERVLQELARMAFFDPRKLFDDDGRPVHLSQLDEDTARAIVGVDRVMVGNEDVGYGEVQKIKLGDKKGALELIGRHLAMWNDKIKVDAAVQTVTKIIKVPLKQYAAEQEAQAVQTGPTLTGGAIKVPTKWKTPT